MTKDELSLANSINKQIEALNDFLKDNERCWGKLRFFSKPKSSCWHITLRTSYGTCSNEITASERLSASIIEAVKREVSLLQSEFDNIGKQKGA